MSRPESVLPRYALCALSLGAVLVALGVVGHAIGPSVFGPPSDRGLVLLALVEAFGLLLVVGASIALGGVPSTE